MNILNFNNIILAAIFFMVTGMIFFLFPFKQKLKNTGFISILMGPVILIFFLTLFWIEIKQPALRSVHETLIWWSILVTFLGYFVFFLWKHKWFLAVCVIFSIGVLIYIFFSKTLPDKDYNPAFLSKWFVPHVLVYLLAYAILTGAFVFNIITIYQSFRLNDIPEYLKHTDLFVNIGFILFTTGLILGAFWAKDAWGHYWSWDIKECWALLTWLIYLIYIHLRYYQPSKYKVNLWISIIAYFALLICWIGTSFLSVNVNSLHNFGL